LKSLQYPEGNRSCGGFEKYVKGIEMKRFFANVLVRKVIDVGGGIITSAAPW